MAKVCVQCDKKIGLFAKTIDGIYCSYACRDASRRAIADNERRASERRAESEQQARRAQAEAASAALQAKAEAAVKASCPKCGSAWSFVEGGGAGGLHAGSCIRCGLEVSFKAIERCPTCNGMSLVIEADRARCPRCKYRRD